MIKCEDLTCGYHDKLKKQGCARQSDTSACKGYLNTIISVQQRRIEALELAINSALDIEGTPRIHNILSDVT